MHADARQCPMPAITKQCTQKSIDKSFLLNNARKPNTKQCPQSNTKQCPQKSIDKSFLLNNARKNQLTKVFY